MSEAATVDTAAPPPSPPGRRILRFALWVGAGLAGLLVLLAATGLLLNTGPGRRVAAGVLGELRLSNGLAIHIGRIDGSIYGRMVLRDVVVTDVQGPFIRSPAVTLEWRPLKLLSNHVQVEELSSDLVDVLRRPALKPSVPHPNEKLLPDQDITLGRLRVGTLILERPVTGALQRVTVAGGADIADGRAQLGLQARALQIAGLGGGDQLAVRLDAEPDRNRLLLDAHARGAADGAIAGLLKLRAPVSLDLAGQGTWAFWQGRLDVRVADRSLVGADLSETRGLYAARGQAVPRLVTNGALARLADPSVAFDLKGAMKDRVVHLDGRFASPQMSLALAGGAGLADSTLRSLRVQFRLARPEAVSPQVSGSDVRADLLLDGPMARPRVDYDMSARALGFAKDRLEMLKASGRVELGQGRHLQVVVHGSAARLAAPGKLDGVIRDIRLAGQVAGEWTGQARGRIDLRSSALAVGAVITGSTRSQAYAATATGRLETAAVQALGLESVLGGPATFTAELDRSPDVTARVRSLRLASPALKVTSAAAELRADGGLTLDARAVSAPYGPIALTAAGTLKSPTARLTAAHPKVGVQLTNFDARLAKAGAVYRITATAGTPYGQLAAAAGVTLGSPMTLDLARASLGGLNLTGRLVRTAEGPFAGALALTGDGLSGALRLSAAGAVQRADALVRANQARLPLNPALTVGGGAISASAVLTPGRPSVTARADLANVRRGGFELTSLQAGLDERGGAGRATIATRGSERVPFDLASTVAMTPTTFIVDARGSANRVAFRLQQPARIAKAAGAWRLSPATVLLPSGRIDASGYYGRGAGLSLKLQQVDLAMTQGFAPELGLGGLASGTVDLAAPAAGGMPQGRAVLKVADFTRSSLAGVSEPVDVSVAGGLAATGANLNGVVRWRGLVVGRVQTQLAPATSGAGWMQRLQAGALRGGVRYNGPSEALWALSGLSGQTLSGPIAIGADVSGRADAPQLRGVVHAQDLRYENLKYGTRVDRLAIQVAFSGTRLQLTSLKGRAGSGTISGSGYADLSLAKGLPADLTLTLDHAQLARSADLAATMTGRLRVTNSRPAGGLISGALTLDNARYVVTREAATEMTPLEGVHRKGQPLQMVSEAGPALPISSWKLDVGVHALNQIFVAGMGLDSEWRADLHVTGDINHPATVGDITVVRGTYSFGGRDLQLTDGTIHLDGSSPPNPTLAITASSTVNDVTADINIAGTAASPQITFSSTPALPQDEVLSRLMFGAATPQLSPMQAVQLAASLNALRGHGGGLGPLGKLRQAAGVQNLSVSVGGANGPGLGVGKYISNRIYLQVATNTRGLAATQIQVALSKTLSLLSQIGGLGTSNLSLKYSRRY